MMDKISDYPKLKGFIQHGALITRISGSQAVGTCPFCQKREKFYVNHETQQWDCKRCGLSGGFNTFLKLRSKDYRKKFRGKPVRELSEDRGLTKKTFREWRVGWTGEYFTIPTDITGKTTDLRRYKFQGKWISTSGSKVGLSGVNKKTNHIWICEGEWDGMALSESLRKIRKEESVFAVPGAGSFPKNSLELFQGKDITVIFDNDEAGIRGEQRVHNLLSGMARKMSFMHWPESLPEGFDLRDLYHQE